MNMNIYSRTVDYRMSPNTTRMLSHSVTVSLLLLCRQSFEVEWKGRRGWGEECTLEVTGPTRTVLAETIEEGEGEGRRNNHPQYTAMYIYWTCYSITEKYMFYKLHMRRR